MLSKKLQRLEPLSIQSTATLLTALQQMDRVDRKLLLIVEGGEYRGILSAGDIQRAIIANKSLVTPVGEVVRKDVRVAHTEDDFESIRTMMLEFRTEFMPVLDDASKLVDVYFWDEVFTTKAPEHHKIDLPVIVMAGGKGTRLKPFSNILPKPLFPLGEKTILEVILDKFQAAGCSRFMLSVNYKADFIRSYFDQLEDCPYELDYFTEDKPLGTAGSLHLIEGQINETFFVSNCDIVIDADYSEILDYHREHENEITLVGALKHFKIPYGTLETEEGGRLIGLQEKPELTYLINAGLYLLEPHLIAEIPKDKLYHITDLIEAVRARGGRVGVFPVSEKSWHDIGEWQEYNRTMKLMGFNPLC
jgi:dTDP-glucose pyrophosphorylase